MIKIEKGTYIPSNEILCFWAKLNILREVEGLSPVDNLSVGIMGIFGTERRPADLTFKHDRTQTPPVTVCRVTSTGENFRRNVVRSTNCGIGHNTTRFSPIVDNASIADSQVNLVEADGHSVVGSVGCGMF